MDLPSRLPLSVDIERAVDATTVLYLPRDARPAGSTEYCLSIFPRDRALTLHRPNSSPRRFFRALCSTSCPDHRRPLLVAAPSLVLESSRRSAVVPLEHDFCLREQHSHPAAAIPPAKLVARRPSHSSRPDARADSPREGARHDSTRHQLDAIARSHQSPRSGQSRGSSDAAGFAGRDLVGARPVRAAQEPRAETQPRIYRMYASPTGQPGLSRGHCRPCEEIR